MAGPLTLLGYAEQTVPSGPTELVVPTMPLVGTIVSIALGDHFVNPVVALALGIAVLDETLSIGQVLSFPTVLAGCWLAGRSRAEDPPLVPEGGGVVADVSHAEAAAD